jgi:hypothetical protein
MPNCDPWFTWLEESHNLITGTQILVMIKIAEIII